VARLVDDFLSSHARRNHANAHLAGMPSPYLNHRLAFVVSQRIHRNMAWHRFSEFVAVELECSLVFFRLIERLAIGADWQPASSAGESRRWGKAAALYAKRRD
jgi:hypothetical protein